MFILELKGGLVVASTLQIIYLNSAGEEGPEPEDLYKECISGLVTDPCGIPGGLSASHPGWEVWSRRECSYL